MSTEVADLLGKLEDALKADDWSTEAHKSIEGLVDALNEREMNDEEYTCFSTLLTKF